MAATRKILVRVAAIATVIAGVFILGQGKAPVPTQTPKEGLVEKATLYPLPPTGPCGGDTTGTYPNCKVIAAYNGIIQFPLVYNGYQNIAIAPAEALNPQSSIAPLFYPTQFNYVTGLGLVTGSPIYYDVLIPDPMGTNSGQTEGSNAQTMYGETVGSGSVTFPITPNNTCDQLVTTIGRLTAVGGGEVASVGDTFVSYDMVPSRPGAGFGPFYEVTIDRYTLLGSVLIDSDYVYYDDEYQYQTQSIYRTPLTGGIPTTIATSLNYPTNMALDSSNIYWIDVNFNGGIYTPLGIIKQMAKSGGTITTLATMQSNPSYIATNGSEVFWTNDGDSNTPTPARVMQVAVGGGSLVTLNSGRTNPQWIEADSSNVYWTDSAGILQEPIGGGGITTLTSTVPYSFVVDSSNVYWSNYTGGAGVLNKTPIGGGTVTSLAATTGAAAVQAVDSTYVYWSNLNGDLAKVPIAGGTAVTFAICFPYLFQPMFQVNATDIFYGYNYATYGNTFLARSSLNGGEQPIGTGGYNIGGFSDSSMANNSVAFTYSGAYNNQQVVLSANAAPVTGTQGTIDWTLKVVPKCN